MRDKQTVDVLVQVNLTGASTQEGVLPADLSRLCRVIDRETGLTLRGLMTIGPLGADPAALRTCFRELREARDALRPEPPEPTADGAFHGNDGRLWGGNRRGLNHGSRGTGYLWESPSGHYRRAHANIDGIAMLIGLIQFLDILVKIVIFAIVGRSLLSWFVQDPRHPLMRMLIDVTEPILAPIRSRLPSSWVIDLSPLIAILVIQIVWQVIVSLALQ